MSVFSFDFHRPSFISRDYPVLFDEPTLFNSLGGVRPLFRNSLAKQVNREKEQGIGAIKFIEEGGKFIINTPRGVKAFPTRFDLANDIIANQRLRKDIGRFRVERDRPYNPAIDTIEAYQTRIKDARGNLKTSSSLMTGLREVFPHGNVALGGSDYRIIDVDYLRRRRGLKEKQVISNIGLEQKTEEKNLFETPKAAPFDQSVFEQPLAEKLEDLKQEEETIINDETMLRLDDLPDIVQQQEEVKEQIEIAKPEVKPKTNTLLERQKKFDDNLKAIADIDIEIKKIDTEIRKIGEELTDNTNPDEVQKIANQTGLLNDMKKELEKAKPKIQKKRPTI